MRKGPTAQLTQTPPLLERDEAHPRRRQGTFWTALAAVEVVLAAVAVVLDLLIPTIVVLALAGLSLALRREGPATLGFRRTPTPGARPPWCSAWWWGGSC
jgi:hypothetical protein